MSMTVEHFLCTTLMKEVIHFSMQQNVERANVEEVDINGLLLIIVTFL